MRIIYGITKSNFGGAQRYVFDLAQHAERAGHNVSVLCGGGGVLVKRLQETGVRVIEIPNLQRDISLVKELKSLYFIYKTLEKERPDVFHTNSSKMGGLGAVAARLAGVPTIIFTAHGWAFNEPRPLWQKFIIKFFTWLTIILSHKTICVSRANLEQVSHWPFISQKLFVVHNGIAPFDLLPRNEGHFTVGTMAELHKIKGLDILLIAWSKFTHRNPEAKLVIMGEGEEKERLHKLAHHLHISDSVEFKGYIEDAKRHLSNFNIFVLPSRSENLPYAVLEAGIAGLPVIASRVGGIPEIIENGLNGVLVEKENAEELFSSLLLLSEDKALRDRLGETLKARVLQDFSIEKMVKQTLALSNADALKR